MEEACVPPHPERGANADVISTHRCPTPAPTDPAHLLHVSLLSNPDKQLKRLH